MQLWLLGLAGGGRACWYALGKAGFRQHRVVDADRKISMADIRRPCLEIHGEDGDLLLFPQVRLETKRGCYRLDALVCVKRGKQRCFVDLEVDGGGHDSEFDVQRQEHLDLPTVRFGKSDLNNPDFMTLMKARLLEVLDVMKPDD